MISSKIHIITDIDSPRLAYTLDFIFNQFFSCDYQLSKNFSSEKGSISYSHKAENAPSINVNASSYLSGKAILPDPLAIDPSSDSFDLFAYVFYFLSRAEEYNFQGDDPFGRFASANAKYGNIADRALVDIHLLQLAEKINEKFSIQLKRKSTFKLIHTVDVDQFYAFKNKSLKRTLGGLVSSTLKANIPNLKDRTKSLTEGEDPYDTFNLLQKQSQGHDSYYFILVGSYDKIDNALNIEQEEIKAQLLNLSLNAHIGLHPSVKSNGSVATLKEEKEKLEKLMSTEITQSRQHFLKLHFPDTYQQLINHKIKTDHSMAYHDTIGFRAGTSNPFYWFDLSKNEATDLLIQPLLVMDVTLKKYLNLEPDEAIEKTKSLIDHCKELGAPFSLLWHNSSFYEQEGWTGWKEVYLAIVNYCQELSA